MGNGQTMKVMIAQHTVRAVTQRFYTPQHGKGLRPSVDQVPAEDQAILTGAKADFRQQALQCLVAAL